MAVMASQSQPGPSLTPLPARSPLPLSASQEAQVREIYHKRVRAKCADEIREFAICARNNTYTSTFVCRPQQRLMNSCMLQYATLEEQDRAREEWFATRDQRRRERELKEEKRKAAEKFHREWWGLDEHGRRIEKTEDAAKSGRALGEKIERVLEEGKT